MNMLVTKKNQYALRAIFELAKHRNRGPVRIADIAETQAIPFRFLEVIMVELKKGGFVKSKRGLHGGYELLISPSKLRVGDVMRFLLQDTKPDECVAPIPETKCPFQGQCAFYPMWQRVKDAMFEVYDDFTFQQLLECENHPLRYPLSVEAQHPDLPN
jgi:Rrf2 family protein